MPHAAVPRLMRPEIGILDGFVRLSLGIETLDNIINDLASALDTL